MHLQTRQIVRFVLLVCLCQLAAADNTAIKTGMMTFAVFSQPAPKSVEMYYYKVGEPFTFLPGSIVDYFGVVGAMPVMIAFDMDREKITWLLNKVDGIVFTSGPASLKGGYHDTIKFALDWAIKRNQQGAFFPVLALGNGAEQLIQAELELHGVRDDVLKCVSAPASSVMKSGSASQDLPKAQFWGAGELGELISKRFGDHSMYYGDECVLPISAFTGCKQLKDNYHIVAEDSKANVAIFEHIKLPIYGAFFHPEKTLFERGENYHLVDRSEHSTELARAIMRRISELVYEKGDSKSYKKISNQVKQYFGIFRPSEYPATTEYERIYTFQRFHDGY